MSKKIVGTFFMILLAGIWFCSCADSLFEGNISGEKISLYEDDFNATCVLTVEKKDGSVTIYTDDFCNSVLDYVTIKRPNASRGYSVHNYLDEEVMAKAQKKFLEYIEKIKKTKNSEASELL